MRAWIVALILPILAVGCSSGRDPWAEGPKDKPRILASFPPLYCFAAAVGGEHVDVLCLLTGDGPHGYQPTTGDAQKVRGADMFVVNGLSLDEAFCRTLTHMARKFQLKPTAIGDAIDPSLLVKMAEHNHDHADGHHHEHGEFDPHIWLGPKQAQAMVDEIAKTLSKNDPAHAADFAKNAAAFKLKIEDLQAKGLERLKDKKSKKIVAQHESLRYFTDGFGLDLVGSIQIKPGIDPASPQFAELVDKCRKQDVRLIAVEPQYAQGYADRLAKLLRGHGVDAKIVTVDPIETATPGARGNPDPNLYIERMKANIDAIAEALP